MNPLNLLSPTLDVMTLLRLCALIALPIALGWVVLALVLRQLRPPLTSWAGFNALLAVGLFLATARGKLPDLVGYVIADLLLILAFVLWRHGNRLFFGLAANERDILATWGVLAVALHVGDYPEGGLVAGAAGIYGFLVWLNLQGSRELWDRLGSFHWLPRVLVVAPTAGFGLFSLVKLVLIAFAPGAEVLTSSVLLQQPGPGNIAYVLSGFFGILGVNIGFIFLLVIRLHGDLGHFHYLAQHDALTDLFNRRELNDALGREIARRDRNGGGFALLMVDVDHFKRYNDEFGHPAGDEVLRRLAATLVREARREDVVARIGGEEFCILLPGSGRDEAVQAAERLRRAVAAEALAAGRVSVTISIGVAEHRAGESPDGLIDRADRALYRAKQSGRDRVEADS